jgi:hypothetical protein
MVTAVPKRRSRAAFPLGIIGLMIVLVYFLWEPQLHPDTLEGTSEFKSEWSRINPWAQSGGAASSEGTSSANQFNFTNGNVPVGDDDVVINFMMAPADQDNTPSNTSSSFGQRVYETFRPAAASQHKNPLVVPIQNSKFHHSAAVMFEMEELFLDSKYSNATTIPDQNETAFGGVKKLNTTRPMNGDKLLSPKNSTTDIKKTTQSATIPSNSTRRWLRTITHT